MRQNRTFAAAAAIALTTLTLSAVLDDADARTRRGGAAAAREHGQRTRDVTVRGQNGRERSSHTERTWDRSDGARTRDRTTTFNDGSQRSTEVDVLRTGQGEYSASREITTRNGDTRVQTGEFSVSRTENGRSLTGDINTTNQGQIDYNRDVVRTGDGGRSVNSSATFEDGTSITRASAGSCAIGACSSTGVITGRDGGQTSWDQTRTRTEMGAERTRDVTFSDGTTRSVDVARTGNGDGTGTIERTVTDRNGDTHTQTGDYEVTRTP